MYYNEFHQESPPCGQCRPEINERNIQAWQIYQMANMEHQGPSASVVIELSRAAGLSDPVEILVKVQEIMAMVSSLKEF